MWFACKNQLHCRNSSVFNDINNAFWNFHVVPLDAAYIKLRFRQRVQTFT